MDCIEREYLKNFPSITPPYFLRNIVHYIITEELDENSISKYNGNQDLKNHPKTKDKCAFRLLEFYLQCIIHYYILYQ